MRAPACSFLVVPFSYFGRQAYVPDAHSKIASGQEEGRRGRAKGGQQQATGCGCRVPQARKEGRSEAGTQRANDQHSLLTPTRNPRNPHPTHRQGLEQAHKHEEEVGARWQDGGGGWGPDTVIRRHERGGAAAMSGSQS